jgi:MFS family permease
VNDRSGRWSTVWAIALPLAVLSIDFGGTSVALPAIGEDLEVGASALSWVLNAFALGAAAPLVVAGRVADRNGRRQVLLAGLVVFLVATVTCGLAPNFGVLVAGRTVQGVGTALFMAPSLGILVAAFDEPFRTRATGVWGAAGGAALAGGPIVAGVLTQFGSWRWFFLVNVPVLIAAMVMVVRSVDESRDPEAEPLDPVVATSATAAIALLLLALQSGVAGGWWRPPVALATLGLVVAVLVLRARRRHGAAPLVDRHILTSTRYRRSTTVAFLANWGFGAGNFFLTLYLQDILGWNALETGLAFLGYSVPFAVLGFTIGPVTSRFGLRRPLTAGMALITISFLAFALIGPTTGAGLALVGLVVSGFGQGLAFNTSTTASMGAVPTTLGGAASGVLATVRNLGIVFGVGTATFVAEAAGGDLPASVDAGTAATPAATASFTDGLTAAALVIAAVSAGGAAVAARVRDTPG